MKDDEPSDDPRLLWFRTWRGVYAFVLLVFVVMIGLLVCLARLYER